MRKNIYVSLCVLIAMTFMACQDELESSNVKAGLPAKLTLSIQVPSANKVVNSRGIYDYESEVTELALFMYEQGGRKVFVNLTGELETSTGPTDKGGRTYTLSKDIEGDELSGNYRVYAVANWSSPFCGKTLSDLEKLSEVDLKLAMANSASGVTSLSGTERLPMTYADEIEIKSLEEAPEGTPLSIKLKRITSHIIFNFKNGTGNNNPKFTPTSYTVYNLPDQAYLVNREDNKIESGTVSYSSSSSIPVSGSEFEFFMLENVQDNGKNTSVAEREEWNGVANPGASPEDKTFSYAPANSTFVVVKGEYSDDEHFGEVSYTIHLGNFGKSEGANIGNFTVNRNEKHTYTVTVNGVDKIVTEAESESEEEQPGGEGTITEISKGSNFVLDAHYETIMLSFPLDGKCSRTKMSIKTPFNNATYELDRTEDYYANVDYQWVHFMRPESTTAFPNYNSSKAVDIVEFAKKLKDCSDDIAKYDNNSPFMIEGNTVYTVAFVDEYFYDGKDWPTFVDQDNRVLIFNPAPATSTDGNSTYYDDYIFQISQRSIKTTYAHNANVNAFGIETWNETGKSQFGNSEEEDSFNDLYKSYGYANTQYLAEGKSLNFSQIGYFKAPSNNSKDEHVFSIQGTLNGYLACMTRNRDEDGNGKIEGAELKWYLPALEQYTTIWMGRDRLLEDTRLFADEDFEGLTDDKAKTVNLWTSSPGEYRVYWPAEGASYGGDKSKDNDQPNIGVRCVRNLKNTSGQIYPITDGTSMKGQSVIIVDGVSPNSLRATSMTGEYTSGHDERDSDNRLYKAFEVAQHDLSSTIVTYKITLDESECSGSGTSGSYNLKLKVVPDENYYYYCQGEYLDSKNNYTWTVEKGNYGDSWMTIEIEDENYNRTAFAVKYEISDKNELSGIVLYSIKGGNLGDKIQELNFDGVDETITIRGGISNSDWYNVGDLSRNLCSENYSQEEDGSDLGQWRIPNQRELMLMAQYGYFEEGIETYAYASRTSYTANSGKIFSYLNSHITIAESNYVIRCVRDYHGTIVRDETQTVENTASSYDSAYISGGTGAGVK